MLVVAVGTRRKDLHRIAMPADRGFAKAKPVSDFHDIMNSVEGI